MKLLTFDGKVLYDYRQIMEIADGQIEQETAGRPSAPTQPEAAETAAIETMHEPAPALPDETAIARDSEREVLKKHLVAEFSIKARNYLRMLGLGEATGDIPFEEIVTEILSQQGLELSQSITLPFSREFYGMMNHLAHFFHERLSHSYNQGNLLMALKFLILLNECRRIAGDKLLEGVDLRQYFNEIKKRNIPGSELASLLDMAKRLIRFQPKTLAEMPAGEIIALARKATQAGDWASVLRYQEELIARGGETPASVAAYALKSRALEGLNRIEEALAARETAIQLGGDSLGPQNLEARDRLQERLRMTGGGQDTGTTRQDGMSSLEGLSVSRLIGLSREAQARQDWDRAVLLQYLVIKNDRTIKIQPLSILRIVLEKAGRQKAASEVGDLSKDIHREKYWTEDTRRRVVKRLDELLSDFLSQQEPSPATAVTATRGEIRTVLADDAVVAGNPNAGAPADAVENIGAMPPEKNPSADEGQALAFEGDPRADQDSPIASEGDRPAEQDSPPPPQPPEAPQQPSNLNTSGFSAFLDSIQRHITDGPWEEQGQGTMFFIVPSVDRAFAEEAFAAFRGAIRNVAPRKTFGPFWKSFDNVERQARQGKINIKALETLQERMAAVPMQRVPKIDLQRT